jgi:hypothetical protein
MSVKNFFGILVVLTSVFCVSCVPVKTQKPKSQHTTPAVEKGTLFFHYANNQWEWFYKSNGDKFEGKYFGEIVNVKPHGMGTTTYPNGFKSGDGKIELVGEWKNGETWNITRYKSSEITAKWVNGVKECPIGISSEICKTE